MNVAHLASLLGYPEPWLNHNLLSASFFSEQWALIATEHGGLKPEGGTEHWRYGGFLYWLSQEVDRPLLQHLLEAAIADPDPPMAGNILKAIVAHPASTVQMLEAATDIASLNPDYYVQPAELQLLFAKAHSPGGNAA